MAAKDRAFTRRLVTFLSERAADFARPKVARHSRTLARAVNTFTVDDENARVQIPHYWAVYIHDGRGPFGPRNTRSDGQPIQFLVWFRNPRNDPRLRLGAPPVRARQVKHLTKVQFRFWLLENRRARAEGRPVPMIITPRINTPAAATNFFLNSPGGGMSGFLESVRADARRAFSEHILKQIGKNLNVTDTAVMQL